MKQILTSIDNLNHSDPFNSSGTPEAKQRILLESSLDAWIISTNQEFAQELMAALNRFKNLHPQIISSFEFDTHLNGSQPELPEVLLLDANEPWQRYLEPLQSASIIEQPSIILFGEVTNTKNMRAAIKYGIKDYIPIPIDFAELHIALQASAQQKSEQSVQAEIQVIINAKGGMGASFIATNMSWLLASENKQQTLLLDTDAQFGCLGYYLNLTPEHILSELLNQVDELDELTIDSFMSKHGSGLHLLSSRNDNILAHSDNLENLPVMLKKVRRRYQQIVVDMSRGIEQWNLPLIEQASNIFLVVQQSVSSLRDASILIKQLHEQVGIDDKKLHILTNRYYKKVQIGVNEISHSLQVDNVLTLPNDFKLASESTNLGMPMAEMNKNSALAKELKEIINQFVHAQVPIKKGLLSRLFGK